MKSYKILLLFTFLIFLSCNFNENQQTSSYNFSQNKKKEIILENPEILDTPYYLGYPDEDDPGWKPVKIPFIHKLPEKFNGNSRNFWIRGEFITMSSGTYQHSDYYAVDLGILAAVDMVFINKQFIGENDSIFLYKWILPSSYILPDDIFLKKKNEVYIRILLDNKYTTITSNITLQDKSTYLQTQNWYNFLFSQFPMGFSILLIGLFIILLKNFIHFNNKRYLLYALYVFLQGIAIQLIYFPTNFMLPNLSISILFSLFPVHILFIILISQSIYEIYFTRQNFILSIITLAFSIFTCIQMVIQYFYTFDQDMTILPVLYITIPYAIYYLYLMRLLNALKFDSFKNKIILSLFIATITTNILISIGFIFNIWHVFYNNIGSTLINTVIIIIFETKESKKRRTEIDRMYKILQNKNTVLTESAEQKIEKITAFLNENYTSAISREGLAFAAEMSPNYMSKLFSVHKGKKISEYINHLRIADAAEQLEKSGNGKKIMDIAISVGFESLPTFNRIFKEIIGLSPREYKKRYN